MPSSRGLKETSQGSALGKGIEKLCQELDRTVKAKGRGGIAEDTLESIYDTLHTAKATEAITETAVRSLLSILENDRGELCCPLDVKVFCVILEIALRSEECRESERALVLLAKELHTQSTPQEIESSHSILVEIAKQVNVAHLIEYFVDRSKPDGMRRWTGIIIQQLLRGPEAVSEQFQHTPEDVRRSIGPMIINEDNEILRLICGRVFASLLNANVLPEELCPVKTDKREYEDFPVELQNLNEWKSRFQQWVDRKWPDNESQTPPHMLYYSLGVVTIPPIRLGTLGESIELVLEDGYILLLKSSTEQELDQILQVPCKSISRVSVIDSSIIINKREVYDVVFDIKNCQERPSYLNSRPTTLQQLRLTTDSNRNELMIDLHNECLEAEFQPERIHVSQAEDDILVQGKGSSPDAESYERPSEDEHQPATTDPITSESEDEALDNLFNLDRQIQAGSSRHQADNNISLNVIDKLKQSQQKSSRNYAANKVDLPEHGDDMSFSDSPTMPTHRKNIASFDEALGIDDESSKISGQALLLRQEGKSRSQISQPLPITGRLTQKIADDVTLTVKTKGKVSASLKDGREALIPEAQPSTSQAAPNQNANLKANKVSKKYAVKPKTPIAGLKSVKMDAPLPSVPETVMATSANKNKSDEGSALVQTDIYDLLEINDDGRESKTDRQSNQGTRKKPGSSKPKGKSTSSKGKSKSTKTYQKAKPIQTAVEEPIVTKRISQRAAASQARLSISKINNDLEEIEDGFSDGRDSGTAQPNVSRKRKTAEQPAELALSEIKFSSVVESAAEEDKEALVLQQQDAQVLSLVDNSLPPGDPFAVDDLYSASPLRPKDQQGYSRETPAQPSRKKAAVNFASQLDDLLSDDNNGDNKTTHMKNLNKSLFKKNLSPITPPEKSGNLQHSTSESRSSFLNEDLPETGVEDAKYYNSHKGPDLDSEKLQLEDGSSSQPTQRVEEVVLAIPRETEDKKSQMTKKTNDLEEMTDTKLPTRADEKIITKMDECVMTADIIDPVLAIPSHSLSTFLINFKQEVIHKSVATKASASTDHQPEGLLTLQPPDEKLVEEKKRKVTTDIAIPPKRRRQIATNNLGSPSISSSGPSAQGNASPESLAGKNRVLLDDRSIRKPNFIHFNAKGAQNQGSFGTSIPVPKRDPKLHIKASNTAKFKSQDMVKSKRRHDNHHDSDEESLFVSQSPPRKRQSVSPPKVALPTDKPISVDDTSSPRIPTALKSSSQGSRVNAFGSPQAQHIVPSIGHALRIEQRESAPEFSKAEPRTTDSHQNLPEIKVLSPEFDAKDAPELFGPRIKVVSIPKARPAPPGESSVRYVPHTKTQNGFYKDISTMENIQEVKVLPDPFVDVAHHKSSGFTERLRAREADGGLNVRFSDPDKTLVEITEEIYSRESSSPSELSSNSSFRSGGSSNIPRQRLSPHSRWSKAVRPHYKGYADTVHKIADEMVIRLTDEEDASELVVRQYKENATSMLEDLSSKRDVEKLNIRQQIENKKTELIRMYSEAGKAVKQIEKDIKTSPIGDVDGKWQERQEFIQRELKEGRRISDS
ncbi:uncharacterized protein Bfra_000101 [Botrytis fragariae]|uniref:Uncharacterized protein n=1 Tax=Botrytis fragariae TaxID=1964551 RepID=A0A8H6EMQ2_9HELO|nr:uncharacterized protein Bfra_000101 [Botrytis fragariae]KAF5877937.1 hypothetical protein Bfra_000101 [Botrytis fragariae]